MRYSDRSWEIEPSELLCYVCGQTLSVGVDIRHSDGTLVCEELRPDFKPLRSALPEEARMNELEAKLRLEIDPAQPGVSRRVPFPVGLVLMVAVLIAAVAGCLYAVLSRWP